jgi:hypothetical protein
VNTYLSHEHFAADFLGPLTQKHRSLHLLFVTCHMVKGYPNGEIETGNPHLQITIAAGHSLGTPNTDDNTGKDYTGLVRQGQEVAQNALGGVVIDNDEHTLLIAYAGKDSFADGLAEALLLRRKTKRSTLVLVTCNCNLEEKLRVVGDEPLVGAIYVTGICGGMSAMRDILEAAVKNEYPTLN